MSGLERLNGLKEKRRRNEKRQRHNKHSDTDMKIISQAACGDKKRVH